MEKSAAPSAMKFIEKHQFALIAGAITLCGLYHRFYKLITNGFLGDERFQYSSTDGPFKKFWHRLTYGDHSSFPGEYLLTYPFMKMFGKNQYGLAIPKIAATLFAYYLLYLLCRRFCKNAAGVAVAFLVFSLNNTLIIHAFEFRPYSVLPALALGGLYFSDLALREYKNLSGLKKILIGLFFFVAVNYHAYGIAIIGLPVIFSVLYNRNGSWLKYLSSAPIKYLACCAAFCTPVWMWYASLNHFGMHAYVVQSISPPFDFFPNPLDDAPGFFRVVLGNLLGGKILYPLLAAAIIAVFLPSNNQRWQQVVYFLLLIVLPLELILLVDLKSNYWFIQRQFVWVMGLFALLLGWCWDSLAIFLWPKFFAKISRRQ